MYMIFSLFQAGFFFWFSIFCFVLWSLYIFPVFFFGLAWLFLLRYSHPVG